MAIEHQASPRRSNGELPDRLPVLPLDGNVIFPQILAPMAVSRPEVVQSVKDTLETHRHLALVAVRPDADATSTDAANPPFYGMGTLGFILQLVELPDGSVRMLVQGRTRLRIHDYFHGSGRWSAQGEPVEERRSGDEAETEALHRVAAGLFQEIASHAPDAPPELKEILQGMREPGRLADFITSHLNLDLTKKQALLEELDVTRRLERVVQILSQEQQVIAYGSDLKRKLQEGVDRTQREFWLREQLRLIRQELGEGDSSDAALLRRQLESANMPPEARTHAERELDRLEKTLPQAAEYHVIRSYLEWLVSMPWSVTSEETIDLDRARQILDRDHFDLEDVKDRIIELLAVRKLNPEQSGPILCFVGPPGVGKTSVGRSIAEALGRRFTRISLGGLRDEAEIRGHRRTYVGALPGRIIQEIRRVGAADPVFMLDEIDKIGQDFRGDPTAALLEVLDPAQNHTFGDHYLEVPFDLSRVMFITTANTLGPVPPALQDRVEVLELPGYTSAEKFEIARRHLIPRQLEQAGLVPERVCLTNPALRQLIAEYTREAGVRELERQIARVLRKVAVRVVQDGEEEPIRITRRNLKEFAGTRRFETELASRSDEVGTATALAYTPAGGQILFVEAVGMPGEGEIHLTGHLGAVMKESAQAAFSFVRSHCAELDVPVERFRRRDLHLHIPAGATPKDGPSAGVAMVVALASLFTGRPVHRYVAMTGEVTLRGHVLPVGGIKEKLIAAAQAGIRTVLLPRGNEPDLADVPEDARERVDIELIEEVGEAVGHALAKPPERHEGRPERNEAPTEQRRPARRRQDDGPAHGPEPFAEQTRP